ncbi:MAG: hypothetical protein IT349_17250 [Candidatus Eisenbacteria bacterium]|nr:hypothetical protein [Candidatus Eisenbacteria bacterium]
MQTKARPESAPGPIVRSTARVNGAQIGRLLAVTGDQRPLVDYPAAVNGARVAVLAAHPPGGLLDAAVGRHVVLLFEDGDPEKPILTAFVQEGAEQRVGAPDYLKVDGEVIAIEAARELELRCGEASIRLTQDGRVIVKGVQITSEAKGLQRIRGAAVRIN